MEADQNELLKLLQDIAGTLRSVGGIFQVQAERMETEIPGVGVTVRYVARYDAFTPMNRKPPEPEPEDDIPGLPDDRAEAPPVPPEAIPEPVEA